MLWFGAVAEIFALSSVRVRQICAALCDSSIAIGSTSGRTGVAAAEVAAAVAALSALIAARPFSKGLCSERSPAPGQWLGSIVDGVLLVGRCASRSRLRGQLVRRAAESFGLTRASSSIDWQLAETLRYSSSVSQKKNDEKCLTIAGPLIIYLRALAFLVLSGRNSSVERIRNQAVSGQSSC